jgi:hypothetical protein
VPIYENNVLYGTTLSFSENSSKLKNMVKRKNQELSIDFESTSEKFTFCKSSLLPLRCPRRRAQGAPPMKCRRTRTRPKATLVYGVDMDDRGDFKQTRHAMPFGPALVPHDRAFVELGSMFLAARGHRNGRRKAARDRSRLRLRICRLLQSSSNRPSKGRA